MSFILDALRKVDQENRHSGEVVPPVAAIEKLRKERVHRRRQFAAMAAIAVVSAAATALLLRQPHPPHEPAPAFAPAPQAAVVEGVVDTPIEESPTQDVQVPESVPPPQPLAESAAPPEIDAPDPSQDDAPAPVAAVEAQPSPEPPRLVLQGTSILDGKPVAVISDRRVFEGDLIEGALVIRIEERSVELEFEGERFTLTL